MKHLFAAIVLVLWPVSSFAYTCSDVRAFVGTHSAESIALVKASMTRDQIRQAKSCLGGHARHHGHRRVAQLTRR